MHPRVKALLEEACSLHRVPRREVVGPKRLQTASAVAARLHVIARLYDPATAGQGRGAGPGFAWGISTVGWALGLHHTTVLKAARRISLTL